MVSQVKVAPCERPTRRRGQVATAEAREVLNALRHIVRSLRVSSRNAQRQVGLSGAQLFVLQCLSRQSPCSVNELAASTATDQSSVSVVVSRLVASGHVKRTASKVDRRSVELSLTPAGKALLGAAPEAAQDRLLGALSRLKKSETAQLAGLLSKLVELAEMPNESPSLFFEDGLVLLRSKGKSTRVRS
jgi:DNA-binding MarR family transcriptional regulator